MSDILDLLESIKQEAQFFINELENIKKELNKKNTEIENLKNELKKITQLNVDLQQKIETKKNDDYESKKYKGLFNWL